MLNIKVKYITSTYKLRDSPPIPIDNTFFYLYCNPLKLKKLKSLQQKRNLIYIVILDE